MRSSGRLSFLAASMAIALAGSPAMVMQAAPVPRVSVGKKTRVGLFNGRANPTSSYVGTKPAGISMAQQHRNGAKKANKKRHRSLSH